MDSLTLLDTTLALRQRTDAAANAFTYELSPGLNNAVEVALALNQPLLLTGEPGTGKSSLADKVAYDLHRLTNGRFNKAAYKFSTKSSSKSADLFYTYDALGHYYDVNLKKEQKPDIGQYIELNALGSAIVAGMDASQRKKVPARNVPTDGSPPNSVVLIDEIDKASADFPNDLLNEIEHNCFSIKEAGGSVYQVAPDHTLLVILTSNGERELPEPFLRRCVFFHIDFPNDDLLQLILHRHAMADQLGNKMATILEYFHELREICQYKKPATAELLAWCRIILHKKMAVGSRYNLLETLPVVVKHRSDLEAVRSKWT